MTSACSQLLLQVFRSEEVQYAEETTQSLQTVVVQKQSNMVLGILTAVAACPAIIGTTEAVRQGQRSKARERHRGQKMNMIVTCTTKSAKRPVIDNGMVVLREHKVGCL